MPTIEDLRLKQKWDLEKKIGESLARISEFYEAHNGNVCVNFSGGKDSTVLLDLVRAFYPDVPAVFVDTGMEYPEIREFVRSTNNVTLVRPSMSFKEVVEKCGYPVGSKKISRMIRQIQNPYEGNMATVKLYLTGISSDGREGKAFKLPKKWLPLAKSDVRVSEQCCDILKKEPLKRYQKETGRVPIVGTMASDSKMRLDTYLKTGCNVFGTNAMSKPLSFWLESDIWQYIHEFKVPYCKIYDMGEVRTGCTYCMMGADLRGRFTRLKKTHPQLYDYSINKLGCGHVMDVLGIDYRTRIIQSTLLQYG